MKRILVYFILIMAAATAGADTGATDEEILPSDRNHLTVTVAYDVSLPGKWKIADSSVRMFKPGGGVSIGADYMWIFGSHFFFEPGMRLFLDNFRYDNITIGAGTPSEPSKTYDPPIRKTGLRISLTAGYKFDILRRGSLFLATGPEPVFGFTAKTKIDEDQTDIFEENMYKSLMRRYDIAWDIRAAIIRDRFRIDLTCALGMLDVIRNDVKMHENRISIGLGYVF